MRRYNSLFGENYWLFQEADFPLWKTLDGTGEYTAYNQYRSAMCRQAAETARQGDSVTFFLTPVAEVIAAIERLKLPRDLETAVRVATVMQIGGEISEKTAMLLRMPWMFRAADPVDEPAPVGTLRSGPSS